MFVLVPSAVVVATAKVFVVDVPVVGIVGGTAIVVVGGEVVLVGAFSGG